MKNASGEAENRCSHCLVRMLKAQRIQPMPNFRKKKVKINFSLFRGIVYIAFLGFKQSLKTLPIVIHRCIIVV